MSTEEIKRIVFAFCEYSNGRSEPSFSHPPALNDRWNEWIYKYPITENKPESPKEGEEPKEDRRQLWIDWLNRRGELERFENDMIRFALDDISKDFQSLRDQLATKETVIAQLGDIWKEKDKQIRYLNDQLAAKEEENRKLREALKELIPIAEYGVKIKKQILDYTSGDTDAKFDIEQDDTAIDRAQSLLNND